MIGPSGLEQEPRDYGGCHCYRQFATETFVSLWYFAFFVIVVYRTKIVNMGGWSHFILLRLSSSEMLFCRCHLFRLELWCFWMSCHLCFVLLFVILFVGNWGQRALRKEADRGEQYHNHEDRDRKRKQHHPDEERGRKSRRSSPFDIIILRPLIVSLSKSVD